MRNLVLLSALLAFPAAASAAVSKSDFAYGHEVSAEAGKSVIEVTMPEGLYQTVKSHLLADVAAFNAKGELVPHFFPQRQAVTTEISSPPQPLTSFPLFTEQKGEGSFSKIKINTSADGTILEIENKSSAKTKASKSNKKNSVEKVATGFLFDASKVTTPIESLNIILTAKANYFVKVQLEGSQNLEQWDLLERGAVLASFEMNGEKLRKDRIPLGGAARYKYYRLSWLDLSDDIKLDSVLAEFPASRGRVEEARQWKPVSGIKLPEAQSGAMQYDTGGFYPVSALQLKFADQNSIARISYEASINENGPYVPLGTSTFYSVQRDGAIFASLEAAVPEERYRFWRLRLSSSSGGVGEKLPALSIGWRPGNMRFLARGDGPFTIAYGSAEISNPAQPDLFQGDWQNNIAAGSLKDRATIGGADKLVTVPKAEPPPWRKFILGGVLLLGVLLLGGMALQARKEIPPANS